MVAALKKSGLTDAQIDDEIFKINKRYLDIQMKDGNNILASHNPEYYFNFKTGEKRGNSYFARELEYLYQNGYRKRKAVNGVWQIIR